MLARAALRLATCMALTNGRQEPYPTSAGREVHDTAIRALQQADPTEQFQVMTVYTDDSEAANAVSGGVFRPGQMNVTLSIEFGSAVKENLDDAQGLRFPETEPELEMKLDILESQVLAVLFEQQSVWARKWRELIVNINSVSSTRVHSDDSQVKFALRILNISLAIVPDCPPNHGPVVQTDLGLDSVFAAAPDATVEQKQTLVDRITATRQIPAPFGTIAGEIEKASWVRERLGGAAMQEVEAIRAQATHNAPDGPLKAVQNGSVNSMIEPWEMVLSLDQYQTSVSVGSAQLGVDHSRDISPDWGDVDDMAPIDSDQAFGLWRISDGAWFYALKAPAHPAVAALGLNDTLEDAFEIVGNDGRTHTITVTIIGT